MFLLLIIYIKKQKFSLSRKRFANELENKILRLYRSIAFKVDILAATNFSEFQSISQNNTRETFLVGLIYDY